MLDRIFAVIARRWSFRRCFGQLLDDDSGVTATEYGLILAGIAIFIMVTVFAVGDELSNMFTAIQTKVANSYT